MTAPPSYERFCANAGARWTALETRLDELDQGSTVDFSVLESVVALHHAALTDLAQARSWYPRSAATRRLRTVVLRAQRALQPPPPPWHHRRRQGCRIL